MSTAVLDHEVRYVLNIRSAYNTPRAIRQSLLTLFPLEAYEERETEIVRFSSVPHAIETLLHLRCEQLDRKAGGTWVIETPPYVTDGGNIFAILREMTRVYPRMLRQWFRTDQACWVTATSEYRGR